MCGVGFAGFYQRVAACGAGSFILRMLLQRSVEGYCREIELAGGGERFSVEHGERVNLGRDARELALAFA